MIRFFVAEDQPLVLQDITNQIMSLRADLELTGSAYDGKEALEKLLETEADIVFTDIKMPHLSGLELTAEIKKIYPNIKTVIISGYHDYEFMRKAIQLEADEYLLKPIVPDDIRRVVDRICAKVLKEQEVQRRHSVADILFSSIRSDKLSIPEMGYKQYYVWVLNAGPCATYGIDYLNPFADLWDKVDPEQAATPFITNNGIALCYTGKTINEKVLLLGTNRDLNQVEEELSQNLIQEAEQCGVPLTIAISRPICHLSSVGVESQVVRTLLRKNLVFGKSSVLLCRNLALFNRTDFNGLSSVQTNELRNAVERHDIDSMRRTVLEILRYAEKKQVTQAELQRLLYSILHICTSDDSTRTEEDFPFLLDEGLCNAKNYDELIASIMPVFAVWREHADLLRGGVLSGRLENARHYLCTHFNEPITIKEVAERFHVESTYFSKMFKKEFGVSAMEFLTAQRIDHAKNLLKNSSRTVREVAVICGYQDQFYFSRIFKGVTGVSPSEFQQRERD